MQIILTKDLNPAKGLVRGAVFDWPSITITAMANQLGKVDKNGNLVPDRDWYKLNAIVERSANRQTMLDEEARMKRAKVAQADAAKVPEGQTSDLVEA
jgi:hypothetical protein